MPSSADLVQFRIAHVSPASGFVLVEPIAGLAADALPVVPDRPFLTYTSIHGFPVTATEDIHRLLDTFLEKRVAAAMHPIEEREHWEWEELGEEDSEPLPAGPGPYGSGVRALGSKGERVDASVPPPAPAEQDEDADEDEEEVDDDAPHAREPWREVDGDDADIRRWLGDRMSWTMNDGDYSEFPKNDKQREALAATLASRVEWADRLMAAFPRKSSRYFLGAHAGWDQWSEDYLSRDEVIAFVSPDEVAILWLGFYRYYG